MRWRRKEHYRHSKPIKLLRKWEKTFFLAFFFSPFFAECEQDCPQHLLDHDHTRAWVLAPLCHPLLLQPYTWDLAFWLPELTIAGLKS